jgi:YesN/AraC family two-component response regulator
MEKRITDWGYDFFSATNGVLGIKALAKVKPDLVILDLIMPEMDGFSTLKEIRKLDKEIPVIMLTSHEGFAMVKEAEKLGVTAFVFKITLETNLHSLLTGVLK